MYLLNPILIHFVSYLKKKKTNVSFVDYFHTLLFIYKFFDMLICYALFFLFGCNLDQPKSNTYILLQPKSKPNFNQATQVAPPTSIKFQSYPLFLLLRVYKDFNCQYCFNSSQHIRLNLISRKSYKYFFWNKVGLIARFFIFQMFNISLIIYVIILQ